MLRPRAIVSSVCALATLHVTAPRPGPCPSVCCPPRARVSTSAPDGAAVRWRHVLLLCTRLRQRTSLLRRLFCLQDGWWTLARCAT